MVQSDDEWNVREIESTSFKIFGIASLKRKLYTCKLVFLQTIHHSEEKWDHMNDDK